MAVEFWWLLKVGFGTCAGLFTIAGALFAIYDSLRNGRNEPIKEKCRIFWRAIDRSKWVSLPDLAIGRFLGIETFLGEISKRVSFDSSWITTPGFATIAVMPIVAIAVFGSPWAVAPIVFFCILGGVAVWLFGQSKQRQYIVLLVAGLFFVGMISVALKLILSLSIQYAALLMLLLSPGLIIAAFMLVLGLLRADPDSNYEISALVALSVALSFVITLLSMLVGWILSPAAWIPKTFQMLLSNVLCDALTMVATFAVLRYALRSARLLRITAAIIIDILIACFLASASLFLGLVGTSRYLAPGEIFHVLYGRSLDGSAWDIGPLFWTMHTTFLPTSIYLTFILFAIIAKSVLLLSRRLFRIASVHDNPLKLAYTLCGSTAAILAVLATGAGHVEAYERNKSKSQKRNGAMDQRSALTGEGSLASDRPSLVLGGMQGRISTSKQADVSSGGIRAESKMSE